MRVELVLPPMGDDLAVVNAARVSFSKTKTELDEADKRLIRYLAANNHESPFAHTALSMTVEAPLFVARQLWKSHVGAASGDVGVFAWNETSRRYVDDEPTIYAPDQWRGRADNVKQGSGGELPPDDAALVSRVYETGAGAALAAYHSLLRRGVAPEQARMVLPQSMNTAWRWTGSILFFARVCRLRLDGHAQQETREIAHQIGHICRDKFPVSWEALMDRP